MLYVSYVLLDSPFVGFKCISGCRHFNGYCCCLVYVRVKSGGRLYGAFVKGQFFYLRFVYSALFLPVVGGGF